MSVGDIIIYTVQLR